MFRNFKTRISLWYTVLFSIILLVTLLLSYKIIGYQLKREIRSNLEAKTALVKRTLQGEYEEITEEHSEDETHKYAEKNIKEDNSEGISLLSSGHAGHRDKSIFNMIRLVTESADNNYAVFVFSGDNLTYITPKYSRLLGHISHLKSYSTPLQELDIEGVPFVVSKIKQPKFTIYLGYEMSALKSLEGRLRDIFLVIFPVSLLLSILCGMLVTQKTMDVIERIDSTAKSITSSNLSKRIAVPKGDDEISRLIGTLNSMIDRLESSFVQAKQFSQDAAHEIRTPLTIIRGEIEELIGKEGVDDRSILTLENVLEEVQYLSSISERLLMIHNMDTRNIKYHFEKINLSELMKEIYQDVQVLSMDKNISVELKVEEDITLDGSKELLSRLLWNLADNAVKYNKPGGSLWMQLSKQRNHINITISDTGIGIPEAEISKIFNRFYRVDKSRSRELGGSGLGLSICKWIAELHGGVIKVNSEEGIGSEFTIIL
ncbi:HAMP domain-containing protein [Puteibacter caeruleilacunae]|nr:HAMP domain-containing protein [Puteibacter caeruleilacunae]